MNYYLKEDFGTGVQIKVVDFEYQILSIQLSS